MPIPVCVIAGALAAVVGGILLAVPALRLRGPYFGLVTLVAVLLLQNFIVIFAGVTGGEIGMTVPDVLSIDADVNYWYALAFLVLCAVLLFGLSRSAVGLILQASGQDAVEAAALGFNVTKHKIAAFCVSALFSGTAGAMLIFYMGTASVDTVVDVVDRGADHHRRGSRRAPDHPGRRLGRGVPHPRQRISAAARPAQHVRRRRPWRSRSSCSSPMACSATRCTASERE